MRLLIVGSLKLKILNQIQDYLTDKVIDFLFWVITIISPNKIAQFALWVVESDDEKDNL